MQRILVKPGSWLAGLVVNAGKPAAALSSPRCRNASGYDGLSTNHPAGSTSPLDYYITEDLPPMKPGDWRRFPFPEEYSLSPYQFQGQYQRQDLNATRTEVLVEDVSLAGFSGQLFPFFEERRSTSKRIETLQDRVGVSVDVAAVEQEKVRVAGDREEAREQIVELMNSEISNHLL